MSSVALFSFISIAWLIGDGFDVSFLVWAFTSNQISLWQLLRFFLNVTFKWVCSHVGTTMATPGWILGSRLPLLCLLFLQLAWTATYKEGDPVMLYVNKVGPYHNPQETYHYYTLPVCRPKEVGDCGFWFQLEFCCLFFLRHRSVIFIVDLFISQVRHKALSLGEVLDGDRMAESLYNIRFRENTERQTLCQLTLSEKDVCTFVSAIVPYVI